MVELVFAYELLDTTVSRRRRKGVGILFSFLMLVMMILDLLLALADGKWWVGDACVVAIAFTNLVGNIMI